MTQTLTTVSTPVPRDGNQRPLIIPVGGGKPVSYTRATTFVDCLEDKYMLHQWEKRNVITGLVHRPDLLLSAAAHIDDRNILNGIANDAQEAAKSSSKATVGTAIHALTERIDRGEDIGPVPAEYQADLDAYIQATKTIEFFHRETFTVLDEYKVGGTPDGIGRHDGELKITDLKTGNIELGALKIAMQLAVYAHSQFYNPTTGERTPLPGINGQRGLVIHLPAGSGICKLYDVDIAAGWEAVQLAADVRKWRARKGLITPADEMDAAMENLVDAGLITDPILAQIQAAPDRAALVALFHANESAWKPEHTAAAAARQTAL